MSGREVAAHKQKSPPCGGLFNSDRATDYFAFEQSLPGHSTYEILPSGVFFQTYIT